MSDHLPVRIRRRRALDLFRATEWVGCWHCDWLLGPYPVGFGAFVIANFDKLDHRDESESEPEPEPDGDPGGLPWVSCTIGRSTWPIGGSCSTTSPSHLSLAQ